MQETTFEKERERSLLGYAFVVGIDEAGRGPLAGPVVAAAVTLKNQDFGSFGSKASKNENENQENAKMWYLVRDSKKLSEKQREKMFDFIHRHFHVGIGIINAETIDRVNILQATFLAMKSAVAALRKQLAVNGQQKFTDEGLYLLVDGNQKIPNCSYQQEAVIGGDGTVKSIAAASIVAKVTRDRMIVEYDKEYPDYGFAKHKGYGTKMHMDALRRLGPSPIHRMSFRPVQLSIPENVNKRFGNVLKPKRK
ncbi:MAG: ribonuclease HII [Candidatus Moranbacteria bacterium]|nr:ribonuclease HII [Candidatus Moranbacteria bacterium]